LHSAEANGGENLNHKNRTTLVPSSDLERYWRGLDRGTTNEITKSQQDPLSETSDFMQGVVPSAMGIAGEVIQRFELRKTVTSTDVPRACLGPLGDVLTCGYEAAASPPVISRY
jgi:hypothetical protein